MNQLKEKLQAILVEKEKIKAENLPFGVKLFGINGTIHSLGSGNMLSDSFRDIRQQQMAGSACIGFTFCRGDEEEKVFIEPDSTTNGFIKMSDIANAIELTPDKIIKGNIILDIEGTGETGIDINTLHEVTPSMGVILPSSETRTQINMDNNAILRDITVSKFNNKDILLREGATCQITIPYNDICNTIGLTADKIVEGNTVLGISGTAKIDVPFENEAEYTECLNLVNDILGIIE